jgi:hypothetical protein
MLILLKRVPGALLCFALCALFTSAFAANVTVPAQFLSNDSFTGSKGYGPSVQSAVLDVISKNNAARLAVSGCTGAFFSWTQPVYDSYSGYWRSTRSYPAVTGCAAGSASVSYNASGYCASGTLSGSTCVGPQPTCTAPQTYDSVTNACVTPSCKAGINMANTGQIAGTYCSGGCVVQDSVSVSASGKSKYSLSTTGATCSESADTPPVPPSASASEPDVSCPKYQCVAHGTINGQSVNKCVTCNSMTQESPTSSSSSASSTTASGTTTTTGTTNVGGTKTTACSGGTCTTKTTTTTTNPDGSNTTTEKTDSQPQNDFCATNPTAAVCKADSGTAWGGSCGSGFTCQSEDAVQCATAQAAWKSACATEISSTDPLVVAGEQAQAGTYPNSNPASGGGSVSVDNSFDQTERYTGNCPADSTFTVMGKTINIPMSKACPYASALGAAAVAVCLLAASKIALGG